MFSKLCDSVCKKERERVSKYERKDERERFCVKDFVERQQKSEYCSVTRKKSPNVYKSCPKLISLEK